MGTSLAGESCSGAGGVVYLKGMVMDVNKPSNYQEVNTPSYIVEERLLRHNLEILQNVCKETGCKILLAQKAFSMYYFYPLIGKYLQIPRCSGSIYGLPLSLRLRSR